MVQIERQMGLWVMVLVICGGGVWLLGTTLPPFVAALALGYVLDPLVEKMERWKIPRLGAVVLILLLFLLIFTSILIFLLPILLHQLTNFLEAFPSYLEKVQILMSEKGGPLFQKYGMLGLEKLGLDKQVQPLDFQKPLTDLVQQTMHAILSAMQGLWSGGQALINVISFVIITPVVTFYLLLDWKKMLRSCYYWIPRPYIPIMMDIFSHMDRALGGFLRGQSLVCLILGLWYGMSFSFMGLNFGLLIGLSAGLFSFIPYVGSLTALILSGVVALVQTWPDLSLLWQAIGVVVIGQFFEGNVLSPYLVGTSVGLHPVWLMFVLLAAWNLFGFTGLILAVPVAAIVRVLLGFIQVRYMASHFYQGER